MILTGGNQVLEEENRMRIHQVSEEFDLAVARRPIRTAHGTHLLSDTLISCGLVVRNITIHRRCSY